MTGSGEGGKRGIFDDLAGMAGGAFSVMAAMRAEAEAMAKALASGSATMPTVSPAPTSRPNIAAL